MHGKFQTIWFFFSLFLHFYLVQTKHKWKRGGDWIQFKYIQASDKTTTVWIFCLFFFFFELSLVLILFASLFILSTEFFHELKESTYTSSSIFFSCFFHRYIFFFVFVFLFHVFHVIFIDNQRQKKKNTLETLYLLSPFTHFIGLAHFFSFRQFLLSVANDEDKKKWKYK